MTLKSLVHLYLEKLSEAGIPCALKEIRLIIKEIIGISLENQLSHQKVIRF